MKIMKKAMAFVLCVAMAMAMSISAFAAETTYSITVNNTDSGYEYTAYQLFSGTLYVDGGGDLVEKTLSNIEWGSDVDGDALLQALRTNGNSFIVADDPAFNHCGSAADVAEVLAREDFSDEQLDIFAGLVKASLKAGATGTKSTWHEGTGDLAPYYSIDGLNAGYYIVDNNQVPNGASTARYHVLVVDNTVMYPKTETPTITKTVDDALDDEGKTTVAAIGDILTFTIYGSIPDTTGYDYYYYVLTDTMSDGLTLYEDRGYNEDEIYYQNYGFGVWICDEDGVYHELYDELSAEANYHWEGADYVVYKNGQTFELAFLDMKGLQDQYGVGAKIEISYNAKVNKNAVIAPNANTNTANLIYSNNPNSSENKGNDEIPGKPDSTVPTGKTPDQVTKTYVTELQLSKIDGNGDALAGAEFTLTGDGMNQVKLTLGTAYEKVAEDYEFGTDETCYYKLADGTYTKTAPEDDNSNADLYDSTTDRYLEKTFLTSEPAVDEGDGVYFVTAFVDSNGKLTFTGLRPGNYVLTETVTPAGYNTADPIAFGVSAEYVEGSSTDTEGGSVKYTVVGYRCDKNGDPVFDEDGKLIEINNGVTSNDNVLSVDVVNQKGSVLPETGGIGTTIFYVAGSVLVLGAAVVLVARKRMNGERA